MHNTGDLPMVVVRDPPRNLSQHKECCCATLQRLQAVQLSLECNSIALVQQSQPQAMSSVTMPQQSDLGQKQLMHAATASI